MGFLFNSLSSFDNLNMVNCIDGGVRFLYLCDLKSLIDVLRQNLSLVQSGFCFYRANSCRVRYVTDNYQIPFIVKIVFTG